MWCRSCVEARHKEDTQSCCACFVCELLWSRGKVRWRLSPIGHVSNPYLEIALKIVIMETHSLMINLLSLSFSVSMVAKVHVLRANRDALSTIDARVS